MNALPAAAAALPDDATVAPRALWAVVVTYFPDLAQLQRLLAALDAQQVHTVVVDNGSAPPPMQRQDIDRQPRQHALHWIVNADNRGIGAAQNQGIRHALEAGAEFITLFDQDSLPVDDMVARLATTWLQLARAGKPVFAVGPRLVDPATGGTVPFIAYRHGVKQRCHTRGDEPEIECFSLLASGTTFHRSAIDAVGLLDEGLFLEYVDVEWGARARARGLRCYGVPRAALQHRLGDARMRIVGRLSLPLHSPLRHYYTFRNAVLMQRRPYVPLYWKAADLLRCLVTAPLFVLFGGQAAQQLKMVALGLWHGLCGRSGKLALPPTR